MVVRVQGDSLVDEVVVLNDPEAGLDGVIAIHSTVLGPGAGGCRLWHYADGGAAFADAARLAAGMSYKNALAGLPLGGAKAVLRRPQGAFDRARLFRAFGRAVARLDGRYVTAEDVGTSVTDMETVAGETRHVAGLAQREGIPRRTPRWACSWRWAMPPVASWGANSATALSPFRASAMSVRRWPICSTRRGHG